MKTHLTIVISLLLGLVLFASTAYADTKCPEGTSWIYIPDSNLFQCVENDKLILSEISSANRQSESSNVEIQRTVKEVMRSSGPVIDVGIGYALEAALHLHIASGYHINIESLNGMSFGIYGELAGTIGRPRSIDAVVVPMMHIHGESFRISIGYGLGVFHNFKTSKTLFEMKPELRFDWFYQSGLIIGVNIFVPFMLQKRLLADENTTNISQKDSVNYFKTWFALGLSFGYKF